MKLLAFAGWILMSAPLLNATELKFRSGPQQTALVELYTSEGCSSCPPAEAWLSRQKESAGLWKQFVPIAFHVDYWDRLGWRDRFSSNQWTERQSRYAALWGGDSVYTPAVVVNGREQRGWSASIMAQPNEKTVGVLQASTSDGKTFSIDFKPAERTSGDWEAHLALLGCDISTDVRAGENSGRNLKHDFVVLDLQSLAMKPETGALRASLSTGGSAEGSARKAIAIWITRRGDLVPVQATGGWLR
jgi:hypothetical protein